MDYDHQAALVAEAVDHARRTLDEVLADGRHKARALELVDDAGTWALAALVHEAARRSRRVDACDLLSTAWRQKRQHDDERLRAAGTE